MQIKNVSRLGDLEVPLLGRDIKYGEVVDVTAEQGAALTAQPDNWTAVEAKRTGKGE